MDSLGGRRPHPASSFPHPEPPPDRLARLEAAVASIQHTLEVQFKRMAAMQAELDRLAAKNSK
jgi:hypothetical protein